MSGSVVLKPDAVRGWIGPAKGLDPSITSGILNAGEVMGLLSDGNVAGPAIIILGDGVYAGADQWNHFYLTVPTLPSTAMPVQLQSAWFLETDFGNTDTVVIQCHPQPYNAGEVRVVPIQTTPTSYAANFLWNVGWPNNNILISVLANAKTKITELIWILYYADPPLVANLMVAPLSGGVVATTVRPWFVWSTANDAYASPQSAYRVLVYSQAQTQAAGFVAGASAAIWDSSVVHSALTQVQVPINLANSTSYRAYVQVAQTASGQLQWSSGWASVPFTISIPGPSVPATPTMTAVADSATARITLSVQQTTTPAWDHVIVERSVDNAASWVVVRSGDVDITAGATLAIADYETGNAESAIYRAQAQRTATTVEGYAQFTVSQWSVPTSPVAWSSPDVWLKSPLYPGYNMTTRLGQFGTFTRRIASGVFDVSGRKYPIVVSDVRHGLEGDVTFAVRTLDELEAIRFVSDLSTTLLLQTPPSFNFGSHYLALGDENEDRASVIASSPYRWFKFAFTEVDAPVGDSIGAAPVTPPVVQPASYLLDESGNILTDESGNRLTG